MHNDLPSSLVSAFTNNLYSNEGSDFSVTELIDSPRIVQLNRRYKSSVVLPIDEAIASGFSLFLGNAVHWYITQFDHNQNGSNNFSLNEERIFIDYNGLKISGSMDRIEIKDGDISIYDYKVTSVWSHKFNNGEAKTEWNKQLNMYSI